MQAKDKHSFYVLITPESIITLRHDASKLSYLGPFLSLQLFTCVPSLGEMVESCFSLTGSNIYLPWLTAVSAHPYEDLFRNKCALHKVVVTSKNFAFLLVSHGDIIGDKVEHFHQWTCPFKSRIMSLFCWSMLWQLSSTVRACSLLLGSKHKKKEGHQKFDSSFGSNASIEKRYYLGVESWQTGKARRKFLEWGSRSFGFDCLNTVFLKVSDLSKSYELSTLCCFTFRSARIFHVNFTTMQIWMLV